MAKDCLMFLGFLALVCIAVVPLLGGRLSRLAALRLRHLWVVWPALAVQVLIISILPGDHPRADSALHIATYVAALWVVWMNRRLVGVVVMGAGAVLNGLTITLNGGTLPASASALRTAGMHRAANDFLNSGVLARPKLAFLGDRFVTPAFLPFRNVFSVGDVVLVVGLVVLLVTVCFPGRWFSVRLGDEPVSAGRYSGRHRRGTPPAWHPTPIPLPSGRP
jgi:hypothetical protein